MSSDYPPNSTGSLPSHQEAILTAARAGDVPALQQHLTALGIQSPSSPIEPTWSRLPTFTIVLVPPSGPPATSTLLAAAIIARQPHSLSYLLTVFPDACITALLGTALSHPNLEIFKILYAHDPSICDHEFESGETTLMMACRDGGTGTEAAEVIEFLLENGADANESGLGLTGPLIFAVRYGQPLSIVEAMVGRGARVWNGVILEAMRAWRLDAAKWFLEVCNITDTVEMLEWLRAEVEKCGDLGLSKAYERRLEEEKEKEKEKTFARAQKDGAADKQPKEKGFLARVKQIMGQ
ncbi:uncharacterized protein KY384_006851 [Bacidia gigantensis]|uniref:uncharacterized protein n=1 Tax=Bacidia gigantensis TaxID=2732470 RepID=UPI001D0559D4|nr:uncharacterized protein KY384_006851 [Bacidia gigantensis]KAG8527935.1 hypothetical protein KY384_006851 [Bacidia gigantensis]